MLRQINTAITTVGAGVLTAAAIIGGYITRSGPVGAFADTTDTATNIIGNLRGLGNVATNMTWVLVYINTTALVGTITTDGTVTLSSNPGATLACPANSQTEILVTCVPAAGTVAMQVLSRVAIE